MVVVELKRGGGVDDANAAPVVVVVVAAEGEVPTTLDSSLLRTKQISKKDPAPSPSSPLNK